MIRALGLDCLTLPDVPPLDLVAIAARAGYAAISLWVQPPALYPVMLVDPADAESLAAALRATGVALGNLEVFNLTSDDPIDAFAPALALGARLGAKTATAIDYGPPRADLAERFAAFHALCARHGLATLLEPISMGGTRTVEEGVALIDAAGVEAALVIDCVHLVRTGGTPATLRALAPGRIGHVQLCDGPATLPLDRLGEEAMADRLYPGEGAFPLAELLGAVPGQVSLGIEAPSLARRQRGIAPLSRAREAFAATQALLDGMAERR